MSLKDTLILLLLFILLLLAGLFCIVANVSLFL